MSSFIVSLNFGGEGPFWKQKMHVFLFMPLSQRASIETDVATYNNNILSFLLPYLVTKFKLEIRINFSLLDTILNQSFHGICNVWFDFNIWNDKHKYDVKQIQLLQKVTATWISSSNCNAHGWAAIFFWHRGDTIPSTSRENASAATNYKANHFYKLMEDHRK